MNIPPEEMKWNERPTVVTIHGWRGYMNFRRGYLSLGFIPFQEIGNEFNKHHNVNLVRANWKNGFFYGYNAAVQALEQIGRNMAVYLNEALGDNLVLWNNLTIVGFSLGSHIAGKTILNVSKNKIILL